MNPSGKDKSLRALWQKVNAKLLLGLLILVFVGYSIYVATHLQRDIVPDEPYHFAVSKTFAQNWGIPEDAPAAKNIGIHIRRSPYLAYWIFGRGLNFFDSVKPDASPWQQLVFLRLINVVFSTSTVIFTYLFAKELIQHKWWSLLPVFALTNTLMFVLLSSGVSYDNPGNLMGIVGMFFLLRVLKKHDFSLNSLAWLISISLGTLMKETILPLALGMFVVWVIFIIKNRQSVQFKPFRSAETAILFVLLTLVVFANIGLYGLNLIQHGSLIHSCKDFFSEDFCYNTLLAVRRRNLALEDEPNLFQAFRRGYPEPLRYAFDTWIRAMLMKIFGIMGGQKSYYPIGIAYFHILLYWYLALAVRYFRKASFKVYSLIGIFSFFTLVLFIKNYDVELAYGFIQVAHQGRYIFPVISIGYGLAAFGLMKVPNKWLRWGTLIATILLFLYGGPIRFILYNQSVFADWFR